MVAYVTYIPISHVSSSSFIFFLFPRLCLECIDVFLVWLVLLLSCFMCSFLPCLILLLKILICRLTWRFWWVNLELRWWRSICEGFFSPEKCIRWGVNSISFVKDAINFHFWFIYMHYLPQYYETDLGTPELMPQAYKLFWFLSHYILLVGALTFWIIISLP